ncbi:MAG: phosphatidate cytidylyltransferase [Gammaproteobacteria bacterium]|nr:phosphatidate cytidylyltransferase [Gammaproteobacteria bacterium]
MSLAAVHPHVLGTLGSVYALLVLASVSVAWLRARRPERDFTELGQRVRSWWVMVTVFSVAILSSPALSIAFFAFVSFLALKEYLSLIPTRRADRRVLFWAYLAIPVQYGWVAAGEYGLFVVFVPVYMFLLLPLRMVIVGETRDFLRAVGTLHWGLMTMVFSLSHVAFLLVLPLPAHPAAGGAGLVLYLVALTELNDVAQYLWGKRFGRRRIVPSVSPNKTWAGFLGGVATTVLLAGALAPVLTPLSWPMALAAGLLIGVGGFVGDVTISALKRDLGVKDSGSLLPGHGGILDRVDSLTFTAPLFFHFVRYFYG